MRSQKSYPYHAWDWYIYTYICLIFMVDLGKLPYMGGMRSEKSSAKNLSTPKTACLGVEFRRNQNDLPGIPWKIPQLHSGFFRGWKNLNHHVFGKRTI